MVITRMHCQSSKRLFGRQNGFVRQRRRKPKLPPSAITAVSVCISSSRNYSLIKLREVYSRDQAYFFSVIRRRPIASVALTDSCVALLTARLIKRGSLLKLA